MPGLMNVTNVSMENLTSITNVSSISEFFINVNTDIYNGIFFFIILWVLWIILFVAYSGSPDGGLSRTIYATAIVSVISLIMRGIYVTVLGVERGLLTDHLMWIFPILLAVLLIIKSSIKD